ncbi:MAG TPA: 4a-hydroxytetrahydrobiopterin dehydratase [Candidatus Saccharimonadales bacterium]|nr:4a-hydroxytetrahydrobiopterin dehydratase [Candidatus Saccharimonadales bacterium]
MEKLTEAQIKDSLEESWEFKRIEKIKKTFEFADFAQAVEFVNKVAKSAEEANHHPKIVIDYNKVKIKLSTHDANGVTEKDIELAKKIERIKND